MLKKIVLGVAMTLAAGSALAANCPSTGTPFPGGILGTLTCDKAASKCEQKAIGNASSKLVSGIIKCQAKLAAAVNKNGVSSAQDQLNQANCRNAAILAFTDKTVTTDCPCVNEVGLAAIADGVLAGQGYLTYCDTWDGGSESCTAPNTTLTFAPGPGAVTGCVDSTKSSPAYKCAAGYGKCVPKLVKDWIKCNQTAAKDFIAEKPLDPIACQNGPITGKPGKAAVERWNACIAKAEAKGGCAACQAANSPAIIASAGGNLNGVPNAIAFCTSTSGAFLD
jgi:hypothetical protein